MADLKAQLETALEKAAEYELLGCLAADPQKREKYGTRANFHYRRADELRTRITTQKAAQELAQMPTRPATASNLARRG
jgi:hypothetical protein